jgi:SAM-dependent methyltransferase
MMLRSLLNRLRNDEFAPAAEAPPTGSPPLMPVDPGLRDAVLGGWFCNETGELFRGFPIAGSDVVLDVGCGDGGNANFCASRGAEIILADVDPSKVARAAERLAASRARSVLALVTDANPLPLPDRTASKIVSTEVLEHVDDPRQFLGELVRVGRPGAQYLLTVPDPIGEELQKGFAHPSYFAKPNHIRIIGRDQFAEMVTSAGLIIEHRATYGFYRTLWWLLFWVAETNAEAPNSPILENWARTWESLLDAPRGPELKKLLDGFLPKSQMIIARKP